MKMIGICVLTALLVFGNMSRAMGDELLLTEKAVKIVLAQNPKVACYWTSPVMSQEEARKLARFHLVIADMENIINNYPSMQLLKQLNPKIKLLAYSNPMEFFVPMVANRPLQTLQLEEVKDKYEQWFLKQPDGQPVVFWQGMRMLNLSNLCPMIEGLRWNQYHAKFLLNKVLANKIWDGYFMDNSGGNVSWINDGQIDAGQDGIRDDQAALDNAWTAGIREFLTIIRQAKGPNFIIVGNKGSLEFLDILDGKMFENFPNDYLGNKVSAGWFQSLANSFITGQFSVIHSNREKAPNHQGFVLASALLGNGYFSYGQDFCEWSSYYQDLGQARGPMTKQQDGSWAREFDKGRVVIWPERKEGKIIRK